MLKKSFLLLPSPVQKVLLSYFNKFIRFTTRRNSSLRFWKAHRKVQPVSNIYGIDRGQPIDRYYIENFLEENKKDIQGVVLELLNANYTQKYGGKNIERSDVLDIDTTNKNAIFLLICRKLKTYMLVHMIVLYLPKPCNLFTILRAHYIMLTEY